MVGDISAIIREYCGEVDGTMEASEAILSYMMNCGQDIDDV